MKKKAYVTPVTGCIPVETTAMIAASPTSVNVQDLGIGFGGSAAESHVNEADANRSDWGLW